MVLNIWASPHNPTPQQLKELENLGDVIMLKDIASELFNNMIHMEFNSDLSKIARQLLMLADKYTSKSIAYVNIVQPAGSPAFQFVLGQMIAEDKAVKMWTPNVLYAFSKRESIDDVQEDGSVVKRSVFVHEGFITL